MYTIIGMETASTCHQLLFGISSLGTIKRCRHRDPPLSQLSIELSLEHKKVPGLDYINLFILTIRDKSRGHFHNVCILGMCHAKDRIPIFSPKFPLRCITILQFCRSGDHHFQNSLRFSCSSPPKAGLLQQPARTQSVRAAPRG